MFCVVHRCSFFMCRCKYVIITLLWGPQLITVIPFGLWRTSRLTEENNMGGGSSDLIIKYHLHWIRNKNWNKWFEWFLMNIEMSCFSLTLLFLWVFLPYRDTDIHSEWYRSRGRSGAIWSDFWNGLQRIF